MTDRRLFSWAELGARFLLPPLNTLSFLHDLRLTGDSAVVSADHAWALVFLGLAVFGGSRHLPAQDRWKALMRTGTPFWGLLRAGAIALLLLFLGVGTATAHDGPAAEHTLVTASQGDPTQPLFIITQDGSVCQDGSITPATLRNAPHHPPGMMCLCGDDCLCAGNCGCVKVCAAHLLTALPAALGGVMHAPAIAGETLPIASDALAGRTPAPLSRPPLSV